MTPDPVEQVSRLFDAVAPTYDQVGVEFFGPIAEHLVAALAPQAGEGALDVGCGRGAVTIPLAEAVGPTGSVVAIDVSPAMVAAATSASEHLRHVRVELMNAADPALPSRSFDLVASSLVLFFLPEPAAALHHWVGLLAPGGRIGLTTFGRQDETWAAVDRLFDPYLPPAVLDARTSGRTGPFSSDAALEALLLDSGVSTVTTTTQTVSVRFADVSAWRRWTMSVGQRMMWSFVPTDRIDLLVAEAAELLETARDGDGVITLVQDVRHSLGRL